MQELDGDEEYVAFRPKENPPGLELIDKIENRQYQIETSHPVRPVLTDSEPVELPSGSGLPSSIPVRKAVRITTEWLRIPQSVGVYVRDRTHSVVATVLSEDTRKLEEGSYTLEFDTQVKTYIRVEGTPRIQSTTEAVEIAFGDKSEVTIGIRSRHSRPAATVTTTRNPTDMMEAIEAFGSALKSATPERAYESLRGHPPTVELGASLEIPPECATPETGVTIEVPPERGPVYAAAPLVFYLGANLEANQ